MGRVVKRFFILSNAARTHDLIDIRLMKVEPGANPAIGPVAFRRRPFASAAPATDPANAQPAANGESQNTGQNTGENAGGNTGGSTGTVEPPAAPTTKTRPAPAQKPSTDRPKAWHVVLLDSDDHTYEYVIEMMMTVFRHPIEKAFDIARKVDERGKAVCVTTHRELAELRVEQVRGFGIDPRIASCKVAMRCYLEPAE